MGGRFYGKKEIMRGIKEIIVHCADTKINQDFSVNDVTDWHLDRGFNDIGYHFYIKLDGTIYKGRDLDVIGAHCQGHNSNSIGICFEGGLMENDEPWSEPMLYQIRAFKKLKGSLNTVLCTDLIIKGHYEYSTKTCPNFKVDILK